MKLEDCLSIIDQAYEQGVYAFVIGGGDPLIHPGLEKILSHVRKRWTLPLLGITGVGVRPEHINIFLEKCLVYKLICQVDV